MKLPLVSIIIVNWNGEEFLKNCLESLANLKYSNWELILVDNGSDDKSIEIFDKKKLSATKKLLIKNPTNLGFAPANNQGAAIASGKYILLLNNDTKITSDFLNLLVTKLEKSPKIGVIQPKIFLMDHPGLMDNAGSFFTKNGFLQHWGFLKPDSSEFQVEKEIFSAKGACMLIRKEITDQVGLFDNDFFSYFEETDFCWKVWLLGYSVIFYPDAKIYHQLGATSKKMNQLFINYHSFKNRLLSLLVHLEFKNLLSIFALHLLLVFGLGFYYLLKLQFSKSKMIFSAILWNIIQLPKTLKKRSFIQSKRKVSDQKVFEQTMQETKLWEMFTHFKRVEANFK